MADSVIQVRDLEVTYGWGRSATRVLHGITLDVAKGRTVAVVGESGSGKSTLAKTLVGSVRPSAGSVSIAGVDVASARGSRRTAMRRKVQLIPQDPYSSLDPRRTIGEALAEAVDPRGAKVNRQQDEIVRWLETVRMPADTIRRYPHELSGGQRQRVAIARGLIMVQAEILNLIARLRVELGLTMVFISHNLAVVRQVSDEVVVLYRGDVVEHGAAADLYDDPQHDYTRALLNAVPGAPGFDIEPRRAVA